MIGETKEGGDQTGVPVPPEKYDPVAEVTEPGTQPDLEGAQAPEAEGQEFDYEREKKEIEDNCKDRIKELTAETDKLSENSPDEENIEELALAIEKKRGEIYADRDEAMKKLEEKKQIGRVEKIGEI